MFLLLQKSGLLYGSTEVFGKFCVHEDNESNLFKIWKTYSIKAAETLAERYLGGMSDSNIVSDGGLNRHMSTPYGRRR
jgi:hypothetical protein